MPQVCSKCNKLYPQDCDAVKGDGGSDFVGFGFSINAIRNDRFGDIPGFFCKGRDSRVMVVTVPGIHSKRPY